MSNWRPSYSVALDGDCDVVVQLSKLQMKEQNRNQVAFKVAARVL